MSVFTRPKKVKPGQRKGWHYEFRIRGACYRGALPEARTKWQAEQAETQIRQQVYEGKFGGLAIAPRLKDFIDEIYLPWAKANKRSCRDDVWRSAVLIEYFGKQRMDEIAPFRLRRSAGADAWPQAGTATCRMIAWSCITRSASSR